MICKNCIKKDVCINLKNFNNLNFASNTVELEITKCPHYYANCEISLEKTASLEMPICEICNDKCYERFTCSKCGKKVCVDCISEYELEGHNINQEIKCICNECAEVQEKTEEEKLIDELF